MMINIEELDLFNTVYTQWENNEATNTESLKELTLKLADMNQRNDNDIKLLGAILPTLTGYKQTNTPRLIAGVLHMWKWSGKSEWIESVLRDLK